LIKEEKMVSVELSCVIKWVNMVIG